MFAGHFAPALLAKIWVPQVPLWRLFLASQAVDLLFDGLVLLGIERMESRGGSGPLAFELVWMPYSHSLLAMAIYAALCVAVGAWLGRVREGVALGAVLLSHWLMDVLVHVPDVPVSPWGPRWGLGLWRWSLVDLAVEMGLLVGAALLLVRQQPRMGPGLVRLVGALGLVQLLMLFGPAPSSPSQVVLLAAAGQLAFIGASARIRP
jgi:hypothetical protein